MRDVMAATGVSQPFLSQVERGVASPSLTTLFTLAGVYETTPEELLSLADPAEVETATPESGACYRVTDEENSATRRMIVDGRPFIVSEYVAERDASLGGFYRSEGTEFIHVLKGRLSVEFDEGATHILGCGDSLRYPSSVRHRWRQHGSATTRFLHVITAPERRVSEVPSGGRSEGANGS